MLPRSCLGIPDDDGEDVLARRRKGCRVGSDGAHMRVAQSSHVFLLCREPDLGDYVCRSRVSKEAVYSATGSDLLTDPPRK